ncbi:MAG TPA: dTDP-4-dehydrorhamnose reductase [Syntrophobacteraceae bacterium]|nr:dTDP-4-dehydrorhamnose reductase [Syntrophobacteraceae bacterium]
MPTTSASAEKTAGHGQGARGKVLVIGAYGMLGRDLVQALEKSRFEVVGWDLDHIDITSLADVRAKLPAAGADVVINCAAYTAVDRAEGESDPAFAVNRDGVAHLAEIGAALHIPLIHISTDYVFDGNADRPYREEDPPNPIGVYAVSKWEGEQVLREHLERHLIVRTAWLYGVHGHNFVKTILRLAAERDEIRVVADQHGCPTWTVAVADALVQMVQRIITHPSEVPWGTYHFCGAGQTTWHGFAEAIVALGRRSHELRVQRVAPIATSEYPVPARRPPWSVLDCGRIAATFGITPRPWQEALAAMMRELHGD